MEKGDKVKIKFGGGEIGVVTAKEMKFQVSYPIDGKPASGWFTGEELEKTNESPGERPMKGFRVTQGEDD